jgi:hypothetical protein
VVDHCGAKHNRATAARSVCAGWKATCTLTVIGLTPRKRPYRRSSYFKSTVNRTLTPQRPCNAYGELKGRGQAALRGRLYLQPNCVSCAAMICQLSFRFNQVSVQIRHRVLAVPSFALRSALSVP